MTDIPLIPKEEITQWIHWLGLGYSTNEISAIFGIDEDLVWHTIKVLGFGYVQRGIKDWDNTGDIVIRICLECKKEFETDDPYNRYCSEECDIIHSALKYTHMTKRRRIQLYEDFARTCSICGVTKDYDERLNVDHDHKTQEIRGVLCPSCNVGLGAFRDNPELLEIAMNYLENPPMRKHKKFMIRQYKEQNYTLPEGDL